MTKDSKPSEMLRTYGDVLSFLLRMYATNEFIAEAYRDAFINFRQIFAMMEDTYFRKL